MNGLPYYKRYPRDFIEGTLGMPFELKVTYSFVLDLIYVQSGKLPDDARYISGLLGVSVRKWNGLRQGLIDAEKLAVTGGYLVNYRALSEVESLAKLQDKQRENRRRPNKYKGLASPRSHHTEPEPDTEKEDKSSFLAREGFSDDSIAAAERYQTRRVGGAKNSSNFSDDSIAAAERYQTRRVGGAKNSSNVVSLPERLED